jgi:uncharacterized membrane protein YccC
VLRDAWGYRARSARATACVLLPLAALSAAGHAQAGVIATQGAFAGLYAFDEPYRRRARVIVGLGLALAVAVLLGTLVAPEPWLAVPVGALVAATAAGACVALRVGPPREYFIVFTFLVATALPHDAGAAPARAGLVLLGAAGAWLISMAGTLRDARAPERDAVANALRAVAQLLDAIGRPGAPAARHEAVLAVQRAQATVAAAGGADTVGGGALRRRADAAEALLEAALALLVENSPVLDRAWGRAVGALADGAWAAPVIPAPATRPPVPAARRLDAALRTAGTAQWLDAPVDGDPAAAPPPRWRAFLADLTDPRSPAPAAALRLGVAVGVAGAVGYLLGAEHPTWIPLSAAAVLQGTNVALARQRALHRAIGTAIGVVLAAGVLALLLEIAGVGGSVRGLLDARLIDTALGCAIGFACGIAIWPRRSRMRLAAVQARAIRTAAAALHVGLAGGSEEEGRARRRAVHVAVVGLQDAQRDATGDALATSARTDLDWPVTHAIEQLADVALALPRHGERRAPTADELRELDALLAALAGRVVGGRPGAVPEPPPLHDWPATARAVAGLRDALAQFAR